jgi:hypothetical protein
LLYYCAMGSYVSTQGDNLLSWAFPFHLFKGQKRLDTKSSDEQEWARRYVSLTSDNVDKLVGDGSLPTAVVLHL